MFDIEPFIVENCDECGTRHAPVRGCPPKIIFTDQDIQDAYYWYVDHNYMGGSSEAISLEYFFNDVWNELPDMDRMEMVMKARGFLK